MKKGQLLTLMFLSLLLSSCELAVSIFKTGVGIGVFITIAVVLVIVIIAIRAGRNKK